MTFGCVVACVLVAAVIVVGVACIGTVNYLDKDMSDD